MTLFLLSILDWFLALYEKYRHIFDGFVEDIIVFVPKLIGAIILLILGRFLAKMISKGVGKALQKIGLNKLGDRLNEIEFISKAPVKIELSSMIGKFLYYCIFFFFFMAATDTLGITAVSEIIGAIFQYLPRVLSALIVFVIGILFADVIKKVIHTACASLNIPAASLIANFVFYFIFINVAMITLSQTGIETEFIQDNLSIILGGIVAAFAFGYGQASRPLIGNLLGAYYNKSKVDIGDVIAIDGVKGKVIEMDNSTMTIQAEDRKVIIPLNKLTTEKFELFD